MDDDGPVLSRAGGTNDDDDDAAEEDYQEENGGGCRPRAGGHVAEVIIVDALRWMVE